jgi:hypothetical protein
MRILRQTILISSIAAEIESNINRTDWDEDGYKECRRLLQHAAEKIKVISEDRGKEEIPVLVNLEGQHWIARGIGVGSACSGALGRLDHPTRRAAHKSIWENESE